MITHWFRFNCETVDTQNAEDFCYVLILKYQSVQLNILNLKLNLQDLHHFLFGYILNYTFPNKRCVKVEIVQPKAEHYSLLCICSTSFMI